jgi:NAD(P)-dependent dehydrogenase (short-subunit alcohol dehydrogenase family)
MRPVEQWNEAAYDRSFAINLKGRFANPAAIVLTASINAHLGMPNSSIYGATKAGLLRSAQIRSRRRPTASWA